MKHTRDAGRMINIVSNQMKRQLDDTVTRGALTDMQGHFLHFVLAQATEQDIFQKDLEVEFNVRRSTATGILQLMEKNGLLYRTGVDYDARLKKIVVTEKGMQMKGQVLKSICLLEEKLQRGIASEDLNVFFRVMTQMSRNLE